MYFGLTEEHEMLQETVRSFVANECPPSRLREIFDEGTGHDAALWSGLAEMGLTGLIVPEVYGGAGMELLDLALASEVLGGGALPGPFLGHSLACVAIANGGSEEQQQRWLPGLSSGEQIGSVALAETTTEWDPESWSLKAAGETLSGSKRFVPAADVAKLIVVGVAGGGLAVVEAGADGLALGRMDTIDRSRSVFELQFDRTPCAVLAGNAEASRRVVDAGRLLLAADAFGAATELVRISTEYAKTRKQFGFPIGQFQAVKHQLARLATDIEPTRALFWHAAYAFDHSRDESERTAALSKAHITDRAMSAARMCVEIWGGLGFTWECDVQMWFKRAMFDRAFLGTPEHLRERCAVLAGW